MPETTPDRCITPSFSPSTYYHGKLMDGEAARHRQGISVNAKTGQRLRMVMDRPDRRQLQVQVPIGGMPQALVQAADVQERFAPDSRGRHGNEILHQQTFEHKLAGDRSLAHGQRTAPDPAPLALAVNEIGRVKM